MINLSRWAGPVALMTLLSVAAGARAEPPGYRIKPGDLLHVSIWLEEGLDRKVLVRPDGGITYPLAGDLQAAGKTVPELNAEVAKKVGAYVKDAVVTVALEEIHGNTVYVIGEVKKPGAFVMNPTLNVLQALALAEGMSAYASQGDVLVLRTEGDKQRSIAFNYKDIKRGLHLDQNINLQSGDVVLVP